VGPKGLDWSTFMDSIKPLKASNGSQLCRDAVYKNGGCTHTSCPGWHPKRGSREARKVLDAVKAAVPAFPFDAL
jgi:hypothetical protein